MWPGSKEHRGYLWGYGEMMRGIITVRGRHTCTAKRARLKVPYVSYQDLGELGPGLQQEDFDKGWKKQPAAWRHEDGLNG